MTEGMSPASNRAGRQREQAAGFDAIGARYDEVFPHKDGQVWVTGWPRDQLRTVVEAVGFVVEVEDVRSYEPPSPNVPSEIQLFLLAQRV